MCRSADADVAWIKVAPVVTKDAPKLSQKFRGVRHIPLLPLPLDFGHFRQKETQFVAIKFSDGGNAVNVLDEIIRFTKERFELGFAIASTEDVAVRRDDHFGGSQRGPVFSEQTSEDRLEVIPDLHGSELPGAVLPNLVGFTDGDVFGHWRYPALPVEGNS
jgi:hypothetical protein